MEQQGLSEPVQAGFLLYTATTRLSAFCTVKRARSSHCASPVAKAEEKAALQITSRLIKHRSNCYRLPSWSWRLLSLPLSAALYSHLLLSVCPPHPIPPSLHPCLPPTWTDGSDLYLSGMDESQVRFKCPNYSPEL